MENPSLFVFLGDFFVTYQITAISVPKKLKRMDLKGKSISHRGKINKSQFH